MFFPRPTPVPGGRTPPNPRILLQAIPAISAAVGAAIFALSPVPVAADVIPTAPAVPATSAAAPGVSAAAVYEVAAAPVARGAIDAAVFARLAELGIEPAHGCTDAVFVRRVFLDAIGTLPTAAETREFLADKRANKRALLVDRLLAREDYADYWAMKWSDLLRVKAEFPVNLWPNAAQAYHRWITAALRENKPYDAFARELLTGNGSNFRVGPVNFYRATGNKEPASLARAVALTFMGERAEKWPAERLAGFAQFFTRVGYKATGGWKEEIVFFEPDQAAAPGAPAPRWPDGTAATLVPGEDPREAVAAWLCSARNPWFARAMANRVWSWLLGRGVVHEPDDFRADNPPANPALLAVLEREFVAAKFDVKALMRLIFNSQTYQLSSLARSARPEAEANFAFYAPRRLDAEVLIDALNQISGTTEKYSSAIPEPYTFVPDDQRAIALPDGSITSAFLENFGRPARDTGLESERNNRFTAAQRLALLNSTLVQRKIEQGPKLQAIYRARLPARDLVETLYLTILSRPPTAEERTLVLGRMSQGPEARTSAVDLVWALLNSAEFLHRH